MDERKLLNMKQQIDDAKMEVSKLEGRKANLMDQLGEWKCKTIADAEKVLEDMEEGIDLLETKIETEIEKLAETYDFE